MTWQTGAMTQRKRFRIERKNSMSFTAIYQIDYHHINYVYQHIEFILA